MKTGTFGTFAGEDSDEKHILKGIIEFPGVPGIIGKLFTDVYKVVGEVIKDEAQTILDLPAEIGVSEVGTHIEKVAQKVGIVLSSGFKKQHIETVLKPSIRYRLFLSWMLEKLKKQGFEVNTQSIQDVPDEHGEDIFNILQDRGLTSFFMLSKAFGLLDYSENTINTFEKENEIKVLDTSYEIVQEALGKWKDINITEHEALEIRDEYYDDVDLRLDRQKVLGSKRSFRVRTKTFDTGEQETFYTIKRKIDEKKSPVKKVSSKKKDDFTPRECFEKELAIKKPELFEGFLENIGLKISRAKEKRRRAFSIEFVYKKKQIQAKLDIDDYKNGIPEFLEIECSDNEAIKYIIKKLGLEKKKIITDGSRGLFDEYNLGEQYERNYKVEEQTGQVTWSDESIGDVRKNKPILKPRTKKQK